MWMTEAEWLACDDPKQMMDHLVGRETRMSRRLMTMLGLWTDQAREDPYRASDRKLRLFAVACCRRIWPLLQDERSRNAVQVSARYADQRASEAELLAAQAAAQAAAEAND